MTTGNVVYSLRFSLIKILLEPGFDLGSTAGESSVLTARLHMLYIKNVVLFHNNRRLSMHGGLITYIHDDFTSKELNEIILISGTSTLFESLFIEIWKQKFSPSEISNRKY